VNFFTLSEDIVTVIPLAGCDHLIMFSRKMSPEDVLAVSLLGIMGCSFLVVGVIGYTMWVSSKRKPTPEDQLLEEMKAEEKEVHPRGGSKEEWERDPDWWRT
jgi:hypothetical protein